MAGRGGGSILFGEETVVVAEGLVVVLSLDAVLVIRAAVPRLACSIIPCTLAEMADVAAVAADLNGEAGFSGEMGRAIMLLAGEIGCIRG